jgi:hypothetical protein
VVFGKMFSGSVYQTVQLGRSGVQGRSKGVTVWHEPGLEKSFSAEKAMNSPREMAARRPAPAVNGFLQFIENNPLDSLGAA